MKNVATRLTVAASLLLTINAEAGIYKGCYTNVSPPLEDQGMEQYQSRGLCLGICKDLKKPVMALWNGSNCYCGDELPAEDEKTNEDDCNKGCFGTDKEICGGPDAFSVLLTGLSGSVETYGSSSTTASSTDSTAASTSTQTVAPTETESDKEEGGGPNKAAIAAGVVSGVVAVAAIIGGAFFFLKYRRRKGVVEEYRRNATISSFVGGGSGKYTESSTSDSRLEPNMMSQRRQSNGSIADDQDFSRRILKVTNPDSNY